MSQMTVSQMSAQNTAPSPQQRQHWLSEQALLGTHGARIASGASKFLSRAGVRTVAACSLYSDKAGERLARMLAAHPVGDVPAVHALLALMCFHGARFDARVALDGAIVLLEEQDRRAWNWSDVREGMAWLARSAAGDELTRYHVEAGIAWEHCRAPTFADTDWRRIAELYETLDHIAPSPLHSLNRAVAEAYLHGPQAGLERLAAVHPESVPARYPPWHAVIGELHFRLGRHSAAERAWREALRFTTGRADREFLRRRLAVCRGDGDEPAAL